MARANFTHSRRLGGRILLSIGLACVAVFGCSRKDTGPMRFDVSGTVTFDGKPVPVGSISFVPDSSKQNEGPAGYATIKDGEFNTARDGRGTVGGPHLIEIIGFDGKANIEAEMEYGSPLFPSYQKSVEVPKQATTLDFAIPTSS